MPKKTPSLIHRTRETEKIKGGGSRSREGDRGRGIEGGDRGRGIEGGELREGDGGRRTEGEELIDYRLTMSSSFIFL